MALVRVNFNTLEEGEEYRARVAQEAEANFRTFLAMLSSYWQTTIDGPNYARELKAMSIALAKLRLAMEDSRLDTYYAQTRSDFLFQTFTQILFPDGSPNTGLSDLDFRDFLKKVLAVYFQGSIPDSMSKIVALFANGSTVILHENYIESHNPSSGYDISDSFGFTIDILLPNPGAVDPFVASANTRLLLDIIRPAHTLYKLKYILQDAYIGQSVPQNQSKVLDTFRFAMSAYNYEDFRKFVEGVYRIDTLGSKKPIQIIAESHSADF